MHEPGFLFSTSLGGSHTTAWLTASSTQTLGTRARVMEGPVQEEYTLVLGV